MGSQHIDILLLGRTGMGKSTTGNKLLGLSRNRTCDGDIDDIDLMVWPIYAEEVGVIGNPDQVPNERQHLQHTRRQLTVPTVDAHSGISHDSSDRANAELPGISVAKDSESINLTEKGVDPQSSASQRSPEQDDREKIGVADEEGVSDYSKKGELSRIDGAKAGIASKSMEKGNKSHSGPGKKKSSARLPESTCTVPQCSDQHSLASPRLQTPDPPIRGNATRMLKYFPVGEGALSETSELKLISDKKFRVLDTPGFAFTGSSLPAIQANLKLIHHIANIQNRYSLKFRYVLYFLPCRGPPQRADSILKDEIAIMHHYFGENIWKRLVFVLTAPPEFQEPAMFSLLTSEPLMKNAEVVVQAALHDVWKTYRFNQSKIEKPRLMFLSLVDSSDNIMRHLGAVIPKDDNGGLQLRSDVCIKCSALIELDCETKIAHWRIPLRFTKDGSLVSTCHPSFARSVLSPLHPVCISCKRKRGEATGCLLIGQYHEGVQVTHSTLHPMATVDH